MLQVQLQPGIPGGRWACLRALCGHDEAMAGGSEPDVITFLDRLLMRVPGTRVEPGRAAELPLCDCDRLCASIYLDCFGEQIEGMATCGACAEAFELNLSLLDLMKEQAEGPLPEASGPDERGVFTMADGRHFRLPTAGDQREVRGLDPEEAVTALFGRCIEGAPVEDLQSVETAMDQAGARIDLDIEAGCPHCGALERVRFDIQSYLFGALAFERQFLNHEVHCLAMAYGWTHEEILRLNRQDRRAFVRLIRSGHGERRPGR